MKKKERNYLTLFPKKEAKLANKLHLIMKIFPETENPVLIKTEKDYKVLLV